jgi:hypothetical protein
MRVNADAARRRPSLGIDILVAEGRISPRPAGCRCRKPYPHGSGQVDRIVSAGGFVPWLVAACIGFAFKSQARLEAEIVFLRHQLNLLRRRLPAKSWLTPADRLLFVWLYRLVPSLLNAAVIIQPDTIVRWHRAGFRSYLRWKSRSRGGRPKVAAEVRSLIRRMSLETHCGAHHVFMASC